MNWYTCDIYRPLILTLQQFSLVNNKEPQAIKLIVFSDTLDTRPGVKKYKKWTWSELGTRLKGLIVILEKETI